MKKTTKSNIKKDRDSIIRQALQVTKIQRGDKRINGVRICGICGRNLAVFTPSNCGTEVICSHFSCKMSNIATVNMCLDPRSCYSNLGLKKGSEADE